jgi:hypothetical protein
VSSESRSFWPNPSTVKPDPPLPEMRFRSAGSFTPLPSLPMRLRWEAWAIDTPSPPLPRSIVPPASVPMKFPSTTLPLPSSMATPSPEKRLITSPLTVLWPAVIVSPLAAPASEPSSCTNSTPLLPTASVLALAPGCV